MDFHHVLSSLISIYKQLYLIKRKNMTTLNQLPLPTDKISVNGIDFTFQQIFCVIDQFYNRVQADFVLSIPFQSVEHWHEHIDRITHFWWIRLGGAPYLFTTYNPVEKHFMAGFNEQLLSRWLGLFNEVCKSLLSSKQADIWSLIAVKIGHALTVKNEMYRQHVE